MMTPTDPRHGTTAGYNAGCRSDCCRLALNAYARDLRARQFINGGPVISDALGTHRRIHALMALGWSTRLLDAELGHAPTYTNAVLLSHRLVPATVEKYRYLYERLSMRLPPMDTGPRRQLAARNRNYARKQGWPPPLAWDDIDDPDEQPTLDGHDDYCDYDEVVVDRVLGGEWHLPSTHTERNEIVRRWYARGGSSYALEEITGWKPERYYRMSDGEVAA